MAHFAELDENNIVINVIVVNNEIVTDENGIELESLGVAFCKSLFGEDTKWVQTSYNHNFRKNFAGISFIYDPNKDAFIPPKPEWADHFNQDTCRWELAKVEASPI
jgi:hypothetical protein